MFRLLFPLLFISMLFLSACEQVTTPKPRGYARILLPKKEYLRYTNPSFPYQLEYPSYAKIALDTGSHKEPFWINIQYPTFSGTLHISYKPITNNLQQYVEDANIFVNKHIPKADAIENQVFVNEQDKVYGLIYDIKGIGAASPFQFYITDSTHHFLRGALYFNTIPNNDSLSPVIDFIKEDIIHLINTFKWIQKKQ